MPSPQSPIAAYDPAGDVQFCGQAVLRTGRGLHERIVHAMNDLRRQCGWIDRQIVAEANLSERGMRQESLINLESVSSGVAGSY